MNGQPDELVECSQHGLVAVLVTRVAGLRLDGQRVVGPAYVDELECGCEQPVEDN
jgi:hypothetical protein